MKLIKRFFPFIFPLVLISFSSTANSSTNFVDKAYSKEGMLKDRNLKSNNIELIEPVDSFQFTMTSSPIFRWGAPDSIPEGITYAFYLKIVTFTDQTPEDAIENNEPYYEFTSSETSVSGGYSHNIGSIAKIKKYAWQVKAINDGEFFAESQVNVFFGPPVLNAFYADNLLIIVPETYNTNMDSLCGNCIIPLDETGNDTALVEFFGIKIRNIGGRYVMTEGSIDYVFPEDRLIKLKGSNYNGNAFIVNHSISITTNSYFLYGDLKVKISPNLENDTIVFNDQQFKYLSDFILMGTVNLSQPYQFIPSELNEFEINIYPSSEITVWDGEYSLQLNGNVNFQLERNQNKNIYSFGFYQQNNLFYMELINSNNLKLPLFDFTGINISSDSLIFDITDSISPDFFNDNYNWMGLYFKKLKIIKENPDILSSQIMFNEDFNLHISDYNAFTYIDSSGINAQFEKLFNSPNVFCNTFPVKNPLLKVNIINNNCNGSFTGAIQIPIISTEDYFNFEVPINSNGYSLGKIVDSLAGKEFTFNSLNVEETLYFKIQNARFINENCISMKIDIKWPYYNFNLSALEDFRIWGNYDIGFVYPGGSVKITKKNAFPADNNKLQINELSAMRIVNNYIFELNTVPYLGRDILSNTSGVAMKFISKTKNLLLK